MEKQNKDINKLIYLLAIVAFGIVQLVIMYSKGIDTDILWHYKLGEEIVKTKQLTLSNNFTFLSGTEWIPQEWLYEVILFLIISTFGTLGYYIMYAANSVFLISLTSRNKYDKVLFFTVSLLLLFSTPKNMGNRPSEFSMYFLLLLIWLYNIKMNNIKKLIYFLFGIFVANFHGGTLIVLVAVWLIMITSDLIVDVYNKNKIEAKNYINKLLEVIIFMIGTLINPSGVKLLSTIIKISGLESTQYIAEWLPAEMNYISSILVLLIAISFGYNIRKHGVNKKNIRDIAVNCALLVLSMTSAKAFLLFDIVWMMYGYKYLEELIHDKLKLSTKLKSKLKRIKTIIQTLTPAALVFIIVICANVVEIEDNNFTNYVNSFVNEEVITSLKDAYTNDTKILASYSGGNYILFNNMKCFVDTRQWPYAKELSNNDALDKLFEISNDLQNIEVIEELIDTYDFDYIWTDKYMNLNYYLSNQDDWELVVDSDDTVEKLWKRKC